MYLYKRWAARKLMTVGIISWLLAFVLLYLGNRVAYH